jgi:hypothetical protein
MLVIRSNNTWAGIVFISGVDVEVIRYGAENYRDEFAPPSWNPGNPRSYDAREYGDLVLIDRPTNV